MALYDAFVSYSHAKDKPVAAALQSVVQKLGKPWYRRRALRIFRDDTSLSATPSLWPSIEQALAQSRFLILLASPEAAASLWVGKEVAYWLEHKSADTLLIALTDGELAWDNAAGDFARREPMSLPPALERRFPSEPKWIDLRAYRGGADPGDIRFTEAGADFAAAIHGMPKEDLLSQEVRQQRQALTLAWSAVATLAVLIAVAGWQWWEADGAKKVAVAAEQVATEQKEVAQVQRDRAVEAEGVATEQKQVAQTQRDLAERNFAIAKRAGEEVVFGLAQRLRDVQGMRVESIHQILGTARALMDQLAQAAPYDLNLQRSVHAMLTEFTETYLAAGDLSGAGTAADEALAIIRRLVAADASNAGWQRDLSVALEKFGDVKLASGDRAGALAAYEESLAVCRALVVADPTNSDWHRNVSIRLSKVGDVRLADGDRAGARAVYEESLATMRNLVALDPENAGWQRDLSVGLDRIGDLRLADGDKEGALTAYRESLEIRRRRAAAEPLNLAWQRGVSVSLEKIGDILLDGGDRAGALAAYEESLAIMRGLAASDPSNAAWQRGLTVSLDRVGEVRLAGGDWSGALTVFEESLAVTRKLAASDPRNAEWQRDLSVSLDNVGDARREGGDRAGALVAFEESLAIRRKLVAADPVSARWQVVLAVSRYKVSAVVEPTRARAALREALVIVEKLEREGKLTADQSDWPQLIRDELAKLPPEQAEAR
jgi:tetratricopeptide (TPR) repeat protein